MARATPADPQGLVALVDPVDPAVLAALAGQWDLEDLELPVGRRALAVPADQWVPARPAVQETLAVRVDLSKC